MIAVQLQYAHVGAIVESTAGAAATGRTTERNCKFVEKKNASRARQRKPAGGDGRNYSRERRCAIDVTGTKR